MTTSSDSDRTLSLSGMATRTAVTDEERQRWLDDNREAFMAWGDYIEEHGMPLAEFRQI